MALPVPAPRGIKHLQAMRLAGRDVNRAVTELYREHGPIFAFGVGSLRFIWLVGPEANRFVLEDAAAHFALGPAYGFLKSVVGSAALITSDEPEHLRRRRLVQPAFHASRLTELEALIGARLREVFKGWVGRTVDLYSELRRYVVRLICEILLGREALNSPLTGDIAQMMNFTNLPFHFQLLKVPLPGFPWARFVAARQRADAALYSEIARRRASRLEGGVLEMLLEARDETGQGLSALEIRDQAVGLVSAGFDTTSATLAWAVYSLLEHPALLAALRRDLESSAEPPLLGQIVKETLRLYPAAPAGLRRATRDLSFRGYRVPEGHLVAFSIYAAHRLEAVYPEPLAFKPERWQTLKPAPYSYLPFGSGARYCIGAGLATRILTLGLAQLVRDFELTPAWSKPISEAGNTLHPKGGLAVHVRAALPASAPNLVAGAPRAPL